jgi:hypothetical protein
MFYEHLICTKTFRKEKFTHYGSANRQSFQLYSSENNQEHFFTIFLNLKIYYFRWIKKSSSSTGVLLNAHKTYRTTYKTTWCNDESNIVFTRKLQRTSQHFFSLAGFVVNDHCFFGNRFQKVSHIFCALGCFVGLFLIEHLLIYI